MLQKQSLLWRRPFESGRSHPGFGPRGRFLPTWLIGVAAVVSLVPADLATASQPSSPGQAPASPATPAPQPPVSPPTLDQDNAGVPEVRNQLADIDAGGIGEAFSDVPNFIGDGSAPIGAWNFGQRASVVPLPGENVGFVKLSENVNLLPRDRVYFNYSYFADARIGDGRNDVNRFMPGLEKTFADGWTSIEVRTPFAATIARTQTVDIANRNGVSDARDVEFGNMSVIFKSVIALGDTWAWTGGMQVIVPTADDVNLLANHGGPTVFRVDNQSTRLMPFTGAIWAPNDRFFCQSLLQIDTAANGNPVYAARPGQGGLAPIGTVAYPTIMYASVAGGYWAYKSNTTSLTGFAPIMELHLNQALQGSTVIRDPQYQVGFDDGVISLINGLVGCNFEWGTRSTLTVAYVTPFGGGVDRWFDGELRAFWNYRFGPQTRLTRVQF